MSEVAEQHIANAAEVDAAIAAAERAVSGIADREQTDVVQVPVEAGIRVESPAPTDFTVDDEQPVTTPPAADTPDVAPPAKPASAPSQQSQSSVDAENTPTEASAQPGLVYRMVDRTLWALNAPFAKLDDETRNLIGWVGAVTVVTSLLAIFLLPSFLPRNDVYTTLRTRTALAHNADTTTQQSNATPTTPAAPAAAPTPPAE